MGHGTVTDHPGSPAEDEERPRPRRRRGRRVVIAAAVVVAAAGGATAAALTLEAPGAPGKGGTPPPLPPATAEVTRQTLTDTTTADGELGYGPATTVSARTAGTLTRLPGTGDRIGRGKPLFRVDDAPVTLLYGSLPAYRRLEPGIEGRDVRQLEKNLDALGYDGFTVDDEFTYDTAEAVRDWQDDLGLPETGVVELGQVVFAPGAVRVEAVQAGEGEPARPGGKILSYTGTARAVTVRLDPADQRLAEKGGKVTITLPDERTVTGRITEVSTVITPGSGQDAEPATSVEVSVALPGKKAQRATEDYALAAVDVAFTAGRRKDVLTVPVAALVALAEGGFGLEVVTGGTSRHVPVRTGLFAAGRVEVSGEGVAEGTIVGMPK
ncbi:peptidoglycan-binding protein [Spongiactinospora gelatinilytica]|uniref:Peptidoglycan-binding protein n=1 Tax=Spongiactinospora gelatinilytica TaxID=2666298 RepID=A0A2W2G0P3_9ACTN|nr:peptidoglycan-binding protein [Spongiactinospora gelatinilytica]PZG30548.1 peptidoglycan-binding protein [Spongiactinospora gelatinilytica]